MKKNILIVLLSFGYLSYSQLDSISFYNGKGDFLNALRCSDKMNLSKSNNDYVELLTWKAELNYEVGNLQESEKYYRIIENGLDSLKNEFIGKEFYRHEIGVVYFDNNKLEEAEKNFTIHINEIKDNHFRLINSIEFIAEISKMNGKYNKADTLYQKIIELRLLKNGKDEMYSKTLTLYAQLKEKEKKYESAESLYNESIKINSTLQNNNFKPNVFKAMMFSDIKRYKEASYELNNVISHYDDNNNIKKDRFYWKAKIQQFSINLEHSNYNECEKFIKDLNIENINDVKSKLELLDLYCIYFHRIQNIDKLIYYVGLTSKLRVDNFDDNHPEIAKGFNNLAIVLKESGNLDEAKEYFQEAINIQLNNKLSNKKITATILKNLGDVYSELSDYENAKLCFNASLKLFENINDNNSIEFCNLINSFSIFYHSNGLNEKAIDLYKKNIIDSNLKNISKLNPTYSTTLMNYGVFLDSNLNSKLASDYFINSIDSFQSQNLNILDFLTNKEIETYWLGNNYIDVIKSFLMQNSTKFVKLNNLIFNYELLLKNLTLRNQLRIKNSIAQSNNTELKEKYEQFIANKRYLTKQDELPLLERASNYETIKNATDNLEKDITRLSSEFADAKKALAISWQDIQQKLKPTEVVIDLVSYKYYNKKWTDSIMYGAFVFTKNSKFPKYIHLFEEKELLQFTSSSNSSQDPKTTFNALYANQSLTKLFLTPLQNELEHATTIYITPSGLTHQLNFEALPLENNLTLGKKYTLYLLNAASELINIKSTSISGIPNLECFLYGGIDFDKLESNAEATAEISSEQQAMLENVQRSGIKEFGYLKGTKQEVEQIATKTKAANFVTHLLQDRNATEKSLKQLDGYKKPFVLHLATHGFFFPNVIKEEKNEAFTFEQKKNYYRASEDPMLRSGLVFAGANKTWTQKNTSLQKDDGIVTAKEISELDLSQCQLVVLSACETGLGTINGSEGVFGLQRAFKMAGVKNIIMSLWKVPDAQTAELFDIFYDAIITGKSIKEAFVNAQNQMQMKYEPYYWAGFILLE